MQHNIVWKFEYAGNYIFRDGNLSRILTDTGHIDMTGPFPVYQWWLTDHPGNVRVVADSLGNISQTNHYDPYGGEIGVKTFTFTMDSLTPYSATENLFRFGAKEWNETFSDYDFSARYFSTSSARFTTQDPLAEMTPHLSPYTYCAGNPMKYIDPTGEEWKINNNTIHLYINYSNSANLSAKQIKRYNNQIKRLFNKIISKASSRQYNGLITFYENNPEISQSLDFSRFGDSSIGGSTSKLFSSVNVSDNGKLVNSKEIAQSAVHELFHSVRLDHPFELTQSDDTRLLKIGNNQFPSTKQTDSRIRNNIMNYKIIRIDGKTGKKLTHLTKGQFNYILQEIIYQNNNDVNSDDYWLNWPGEPVN